MRIGIDCRTIDVAGAGVAQYGRHLISALAQVDHSDEFVLIPPPSGGVPFFTQHVSVRRAFGRAGVDLIHIPGGAAPLGFCRPYVVTVHDLAIYRHPEWFPGRQWFSTKISYPSTVRHARRVIVPSETTKRDVMEIMNVAAEKVVVVPHGVVLPHPHTASPLDKGEEFKSLPPLQGRETERGYILFLGTIEPRKNIQTLVRAYRQMIDACPELRDVELRIAGAIGWKAGPILDEIERARTDGYAVRLLGYVTEEEKWRLLAGASCFVFPSWYEGFGLPVLEAMAAGVPVICSDIAAHREVADDAAAFFVPDDFDTAASKMSRIFLDKKFADELREKGLARAREFAWERCAQKTIEVYRSVIV